MYCNYQTRSIRTARCQRGKNRVKNIGTGVQELFFLVIGVFVELFTVMVWLSFFGLRCTARRKLEIYDL